MTCYELIYSGSIVERGDIDKVTDKSVFIRKPSGKIERISAQSSFSCFYATREAAVLERHRRLKERVSASRKMLEDAENELDKFLTAELETILPCGGLL